MRRVTDAASPLFDEMDRCRTCTSKKSYDSEWSAQFAADETAEKSGARLRYYRCPYCRMWHLSEA